MNTKIVSLYSTRHYITIYIRTTGSEGGRCEGGRRPCAAVWRRRGRDGAGLGRTPPPQPSTPGPGLPPSPAVLRAAAVQQWGRQEDNWRTHPDVRKRDYSMHIYYVVTRTAAQDIQYVILNTYKNTRQNLNCSHF